MVKGWMSKSAGIASSNLAGSGSLFTEQFSFDVPSGKKAILRGIGASMPPSLYYYHHVRILVNGSPVWARDKLPIGKVTTPTELWIEVEPGSTVLVEAYQTNPATRYIDYIVEYLEAPKNLPTEPPIFYPGISKEF